MLCRNRSLRKEYIRVTGDRWWSSYSSCDVYPNTAYHGAYRQYKNECYVCANSEHGRGTCRLRRIVRFVRFMKNISVKRYVRSTRRKHYYVLSNFNHGHEVVVDHIISQSN